MPVPGRFFNCWPPFDVTKNYITDCITKKCLEQYLDYLYLYHLSSLVQSEDLRKQRHSLHLLLWSTWSTWSTLTSRFMKNWRILSECGKLCTNFTAFRLVGAVQGLWNLLRSGCTCAVQRWARGLAVKNQTCSESECTAHHCLPRFPRANVMF